MKKAELFKYLAVGAGAMYVYHQVKGRPDSLGQVVVMANQAQAFKNKITGVPDKPPMKDVN